ncbi:MAG: hypothetical protein J4400_04565 [Candidatus Aenigmarchaeota archaeon]|nr:hypothetical protein [Candidatus Aenigmarchaeota archaeon]
MPGSTDGLERRNRRIEGFGGSYIGEFPLSMTRDMDPTTRIVYVQIGDREHPAIPNEDGSCRLLHPTVTQRARRYKDS